MGDGSSGFGGFSEFVKDVGQAVGSAAKSSVTSFKNTAVSQVTGQNPTPANQSPQGESKASTGLDSGATFTGEQNPTANTQQQAQAAAQVQQNLQATADKNKAADSQKIDALREQLHKMVYYDPLIRAIEGKDKEEKPVAEKLEEEKQQEERKEFELQQEEQKKALPQVARQETGKGAKA